jgi:DNA processing protein
VLEAVGRFGLDLADQAPAGPERPTDGLGPLAALVHDALPARAPREARWLAMEAGVPIGAVRAALVHLGRRGLVEHQDGRWRRLAPDTRAPT